MSNIGNTPPDYTIPLGQLRGLIGDYESVPLTPPVAGQGEYMWFGDDVLQGLLNVYLDDPRRAAAHAFRVIASSQALLLKKWSADDLSVDGPAIAEALRKLAAELDAQVAGEAAVVDIFELADIGTTEKFVAEGTIPEFNTYWVHGRQAYPITTTFCW